MGKLWNELPGLYESVAPAALKRKLEEKNPDFQGAWANFGMRYQGFTRAWRLQKRIQTFKAHGQTLE